MTYYLVSVSHSRLQILSPVTSSADVQPFEGEQQTIAYRDRRKDGLSEEVVNMAIPMNPSWGSRVTPSKP